MNTFPVTRRHGLGPRINIYLKSIQGGYQLHQLQLDDHQLDIADEMNQSRIEELCHYRLMEHGIKGESTKNVL